MKILLDCCLFPYLHVQRSVVKQPGELTLKGVYSINSAGSVQTPSPKPSGAKPKH